MKWMRALDAASGREVLGTIDSGALALHEGELFDAPRPTGQTLPLAGLRALPPCRPGKVIGLWNNFHTAAAKNGWAVPAEPLYFLKSPGSVCGPEQAIEALPEALGRVAYEGELAVVIGARARRIAREHAPRHVFGYTCANDLTALELLQRDSSFTQWTRAKSFDGFAAIGPVIETAFDVAGATLRTRVGGRERQNFALSDMIFGPHELVWRLSQDMTLEAGDVILCGTSLGVLPMKPGSRVEIEIDGIGCLVNTYG